MSDVSTEGEQIPSEFSGVGVAWRAHLGGALPGPGQFAEFVVPVKRPERSERASLTPQNESGSARFGGFLARFTASLGESGRRSRTSRTGHSLHTYTLHAINVTTGTRPVDHTFHHAQPDLSFFLFSTAVRRRRVTSTGIYLHPHGMQLLVTAALTLSGLVSFCVCVSLASRGTPLMVPLVAASCFSFAISALVLLPVDAVSGVLPPEAKNRTAAATVPTPSAALVSFWRALYWVTLLLGWLATETLCELLVAGNSLRRHACAPALRSSTRLYFVVLVLGVCGLLYLLIWLHLPMAELQAVAPLLVNWHGVLVLALLQGQGMVELPRRLWRNAAPRAALAQKYYALAATDDERSATATRLRTLLHKVSAADVAAPPPVHRSVRERLCWDALPGLFAALPWIAGWRITMVEKWPGVPSGMGAHLRYAQSDQRDRAGQVASSSSSMRRSGAARVPTQASLSAGRRVVVRAPYGQRKGFGGLRVGRSRGLWLGVLRRPFMRFVAAFAALASGWLLANEARRFPASPGTFGSAPAILLSSTAAGGAAAALRSFHCSPLRLEHDDVCSTLCIGIRLQFAHSRRMSAASMAAHRRRGTASSRGLVCATYWAACIPLSSRGQRVPRAYGACCSSRGNMEPRGTHHAAGEETMVVVSSSLDAGGSPGAMGFHGVCSLLMLFAAGCSSVGMCGCKGSPGPLCGPGLQTI